MVSKWFSGANSSVSLKERLPKSIRLMSKQAHVTRKEKAIETADTTVNYKTAMKEVTISCIKINRRWQKKTNSTIN